MRQLKSGWQWDALFTRWHVQAERRREQCQAQEAQEWCEGNRKGMEELLGEILREEQNICRYFGGDFTPCFEELENFPKEKSGLFSSWIYLFWRRVDQGMGSRAESSLKVILQSQQERHRAQVHSTKLIKWSLGPGLALFFPRADNVKSSTWTAPSLQVKDSCCHRLTWASWKVS